MNSPPLFKHQAISLQRCAASDLVFDMSDPGTGKTRVQIEDFYNRRSRAGGKGLVLAPRSLLQSAWADDCARYAPDLKTSIAYASNREAAFEENADLYITNIDATRWLAKQPASFFRQFETLIVDESSYFKHHTNQRAKALNKVKCHFKKRRLMSGSPSTNTITDLWNQVNILDDGRRLGKSFYNFRMSVCQPVQAGPQPNMVKWEDRPGAEQAVADLIRDITLRHKFEDCIDIPPNFEYSVQFHLNGKHRRVYEEMKNESVALLKSGAVVEAINAAAVTTKLLQIASGAVYDQAGNYHLVDTDRYELVADLIEQRDHSVVFFNWRHQRDQLVESLTKRGLTHTVIDSSVTDKERIDRVRAFQAGFYRSILVHPMSAAHGLTFTRGTATIWPSPTYNLEHFLQGNKRIYRAGQQEKTETIVLLAPNTIEEKVYERLKAKDLRQSDLLSVLMEAA